MKRHVSSEAQCFFVLLSCIMYKVLNTCSYFHDIKVKLTKQAFPCLCY